MEKKTLSRLSVPETFEVGWIRRMAHHLLHFAPDRQAMKALTLPGSFPIFLSGRLAYRSREGRRNVLNVGERMGFLATFHRREDRSLAQPCPRGQCGRSGRYQWGLLNIPVSQIAGRLGRSGGDEIIPGWSQTDPWMKDLIGSRWPGIELMDDDSL